jgi:Rieske Fe-S protein
MSGTGLSRRRALTSVATVGLGLPVLAACGDDEPSEATDPGAPIDRSTTATPEEPTSDAAPSDETTGEGGGVPTADVPIGGGIVLTEEKLVITQPTEGDFRGFTAVCTHQGCTVNQVTDTINCPCHGSRFSIETGEPVGGPAPTALAVQPLDVQGDTIVLA